MVQTALVGILMFSGISGDALLASSTVGRIGSLGGMAVVATARPAGSRVHTLQIVASVTPPPSETTGNASSAWMGAPPPTSASVASGIPCASALTAGSVVGGWKPVDPRRNRLESGILARLARKVGVDDPLLAYSLMALIAVGGFTVGARISRNRRRQGR